MSEYHYVSLRVANNRKSKSEIKNKKCKLKSKSVNLRQYQQNGNKIWYHVLIIRKNVYKHQTESVNMSHDLEFISESVNMTGNFDL